MNSDMRLPTTTDSDEGLVLRVVTPAIVPSSPNNTEKLRVPPVDVACVEVSTACLLRMSHRGRSFPPKGLSSLV